jgi:hypothetical protein
VSALPWVALGALLGGIVAVALVVWLFSVAGEQVVALLRQWLDSK